MSDVLEKIKKLKADNDIVDVIGRFVSLKKKGAEHVGLCPFHDDTKPSLYVSKSKQVWYCPACGDDTAKGDVFDFLLKRGNTWKECLEILGKNSLGSSNFKKKASNKKQPAPPQWKPKPSNILPSQIIHYRHGKPDFTWAYRNEESKVVCVICRFNLPDGSKEVLPYTYATNGQSSEWRWMAMEKPRTLYNLPEILARPDATVIIYEGEKTADAGQELFPHTVATTWAGGANAISMFDWTPLYGRKIVLWPDNDKEQQYGKSHPLAGQVKPFHEQPGNAAMYAIAKILINHCPPIKWVKNADVFPHKWDVADAEWTPDEALLYIRANIGDIPPIPVRREKKESQPERDFEFPDQPPPDSLPGPAGDTAELMETYHQPPPTESEEKTYFRFLGYQKEGDGVTHCFYIRETKTLAKLSSSRLGRITTLIQLAPLDYWQERFSSKRGGKVNVEHAVNWLLRSSHTIGVFNNNMVRGRGAWMDKGRIVLHSGTHLIVDGKEVALGQLSTRYVYEAGENLGFKNVKPLTTPEANRLMEIAECLNLDRDVSKYLMMGWCIVAPVCGALFWRSHIWITGPAGSGKSWIFQKLIRPLLGKTALAVQGETSEPGLRQLLRQDALPVVFDEAEGEDERSFQRMQSVLNLMRSASSEDGGVMAKGSAGGTATVSIIRSCFAFASIGISATQQSDKTRLTVIGLSAPDPREDGVAERWEKLQKLTKELITPEFVERLQARTFKLLPIILQNSKTFAAAAASVLGQQRLGDQVGTVIAGVYSLYRQDLVTFEKALEWVKDRKWEDERALDESKDELRLLQFLMEQIVRVPTGKAPSERTIGELCAIATNGVEDSQVTDDVAQKHLSRLGFIANPDFILISNSSQTVRRFLRNSPWANNHHKILLRVPGAEQVQGIVFGLAGKSRATAIPTSAIFGETENEGFEPANVITKPAAENEEDDLPF